ncbi:MAG: hypothetical protein AAF479_01110 [Pseudomonadota bacterium]
MRSVNRRTVLVGAGAGLLSACTLDEDFAGGTRKQPKGGIGGTGIVGTLTDFGSLIINGLRVTVPTDLRIGTAFGAVGQDRLAIGQTLTVEAETLTGSLIARRVDIVHPVIGVAGNIAADGRSLEVAGVPVRIEPDAIATFRAGQKVAVSGVWNQTEIVASRVVPVEATASVIVAGTVRYAAERDVWSIGAMPVLLPEGVAAQDGAFATASGYLHGQSLRVETFRPGRFTGAAGALTALSVEGYLSPTPEAPYLTVDGLGHSFSEESRLDPFVGRRALFRGGYDGSFRLEEGIALEEALDARRRQLRI